MKLKNLLEPSWERTRHIALWSWQALILAFAVIAILLILIGLSHELFAILLQYIEATTGH